MNPPPLSSPERSDARFLVVRWIEAAGWIAGPETIYRAIAQAIKETDYEFVEKQIGKLQPGAKPWLWVDQVRAAWKCRVTDKRIPAREPSAREAVGAWAQGQLDKAAGKAPPAPEPNFRAALEASLRKIYGRDWEKSLTWREFLARLGRKA